MMFRETYWANLVQHGALISAIDAYQGTTSKSEYKWVHSQNVSTSVWVHLATFLKEGTLIKVGIQVGPFLQQGTLSQISYIRV